MVNEHIDISIIIPGFNCAKTLGRCLASVLNQTFTGTFEIIYSDDASTDDSILVAQCFFSEFKNLIYTILTNGIRTGSPSNGRNKGLSVAKGEYIFFLDSDDTLHPEALEHLFVTAHNYRGDYVCALHSQLRFSTNGKTQQKLIVR